MTGHGSIHWNELNTHDVEKAKAFYAAAMGWTFEPMEMGPDGTYWIIKRGDGAGDERGDEMVGGVFPMTGPEFEGVPDHWLTNFHVDDVDAKVAEARANGATIMRECWDVPGVGRIAIVRDPGGAVTGWITPSE